MTGLFEKLNTIDHNIGDTVYFYPCDKNGNQTEGIIVDIYNWKDVNPLASKHYIIEVKTHIDPYLVIYPAILVWNSPQS